MQMEENKNLNCQTEKYVENIAVIDIVNIPNQKEKKKVEMDIGRKAGR